MLLRNLILLLWNDKPRSYGVRLTSVQTLYFRIVARSIVFMEIYIGSMASHLTLAATYNRVIIEA